jgi:hypothetical protein
MSFKYTSDLGMYIWTTFLIHHLLLTLLCGKALFPELRALNHNAPRNGYFLMGGSTRSLYLHRHNTVRYQITGTTRWWDSGMETADQNILGVP